MQNLIKLITIAVILLTSNISTVLAKSFEIVTGLSTTHILSSTYQEDIGEDSIRTQFNEDNNLLALSYKLDNGKGLMIAKFKNSYYNNTVAVGISAEVYNKNNITVDVIGGLTKGYTKYELGNLLCPLSDDICMFISPRVSTTVVSYKGVSVKASAMLFSTALVSTISLEYNF